MSIYSIDFTMSLCQWLRLAGFLMGSGGGGVTYERCITVET